ncbi:hypothetical protein HHI36_016014 [Cryptolaemus montrouzieri]|uniref:TAP-C domain-containing protein n=1 Tax=Cryptolaemus montrouzieri TaxID=559131 RepID=A0ABD2N7Z9_9CUCU
MMNLVVSGMFKELETSHKRPPIRSFLRTLVIVPSGSGYCICNEELHISNATEEQVKVFMSVSMLTPIEAGTSVSLISTESDSSEASSSRDVDNETKNQMVAALSMHSGMNLQWSMKCLQETDWNFDRATMVFTEIRMRGGIPEEAFIK